MTYFICSLLTFYPLTAPSVYRFHNIFLFPHQRHPTHCIVERETGIARETCGECDINKSVFSRCSVDFSALCPEPRLQTTDIERT